MRNLTGVKAVANKIRITAPASLNDTVGQAIERALERRAERQARQIHVDVHDGIVTLTGSVRSWAERRSVLGAARFTPGVKVVQDQLWPEDWSVALRRRFERGHDMTTRPSIADTRHLIDEFRDRLAAARLRLARTVATTDEDLEAAGRAGVARRSPRTPPLARSVIFSPGSRVRSGTSSTRSTPPRRGSRPGSTAPAKAATTRSRWARLRAVPAARFCTICQDRTETAG